MKKILFSLFAAVMAVSFIACANSSDGGSSDPEKKGNKGGDDPVETKTYTVTYVDGIDSEIISVPVDTNAYKEGDTVTIIFDGIGDREYYNFDGWSDGTTTYKSSGTTTFTMGSEDVTLTAVWVWASEYVGTKTPSEPKAVGDIVFKDGSAMPYTSGMTFTDDQKAAAIALIFYSGTGLNSDDSEGKPDNTTTRTLGVGLKHERKAWCRYVSTSNCANAYLKTITSICCPIKSYSPITFAGDKNGKNNLQQIAEFLGEDDDTGTADNYPAFYFGINYQNVTGSNVKGTDYATDWYLPSIAELYQIYVCRADTTNGFDVDAASEALGGSKFGTSVYSSSTQSSIGQKISTVSFLDGGTTTAQNKPQALQVCCIHEF